MKNNQLSSKLSFAEAASGMFMLPISYMFFIGDYGLAGNVVGLLLTAGGAFSTYRASQHVTKILKRTP